MRKLLFAGLVSAVPAFTAFGVLWSNYLDAAPADDPIGLSLNKQLPKPVRLWACDRALARDTTVFRPPGCW